MVTAAAHLVAKSSGGGGSLPVWLLPSLALVIAVPGTVLAIRELRRRNRGATERGNADSERQYATDAHVSDLKQMLEQACGVLNGNAPRNDDGELRRRMFASHFPDLELRMTEWDQRAVRLGEAVNALRREFESRVGALDFDPPIDVGSTGEGMFVLTEQRALRDVLSAPLPPMSGTEGALWRVFVNDVSRTVEIDWGMLLAGRMLKPVARWEGAGYPSRGTAAVMAVVTNLYELLREAQNSPEARAISAARAALEAYPRDEVRRQIEREEVRERLPRVAACPACGT